MARHGTFAKFSFGETDPAKRSFTDAQKPPAGRRQRTSFRPFYFSFGDPESGHTVSAHTTRIGRLCTIESDLMPPTNMPEYDAGGGLELEPAAGELPTQVAKLMTVGADGVILPVVLRIVRLRLSLLFSIVRCLGGRD